MSLSDQHGKSVETYRAFINQPSTLQPDHKYNGTRCIVQDAGGQTVRCWFTEGPIISQDMLRSSISRFRDGSQNS